MSDDSPWLPHHKKREAIEHAADAIGQFAGDVLFPGQRIEQANPDAAVFPMRGVPETGVALMLLGVETPIAQRYEVVVDDEGVKIWARGTDDPSIVIPYSAIEAITRVRVSLSVFQKPWAVQLQVFDGDGPSIELPLAPFDKSDFQNDDAAPRLEAEIARRMDAVSPPENPSTTEPPAAEG